jgi:hypothetical protein
MLILDDVHCLGYGGKQFFRFLLPIEKTKSQVGPVSGGDEFVGYLTDLKARHETA